MQLLSAALLLPLGVYAWAGAFARYIADDYCWAGVLRTEGFFQAQVHWYTLYSPRYAFTFLVNLVELAGPSIVPFLPAVALLAWLAALTWGLAAVSAPGPALLLAELVAFATLYTSPDRGQDLYWQTGMLTYLLPVVLLTVYMGLLIRRVRIDTGPNLSSLALAAALTLVAGGLSESYMIPQNVGLTLALVAALFSGDRVLPRRAAPYLVAGLLGGVVALALTLVAPATPGRTGGGSADLWLALSAAIASAFALAIRLIRYFPQVVVLCLALPAVLAHVSPCRRYASTRCALGVLAGTAVLLPFCFFPSFFANNGNPPARALIVPSFLIVVCLSFLGWHVRVVSGQWSSVVSSRSRLALASLILAAVPIGAAVTALPEAASAAQYAAVWDAEDGAIRAARDAGVRNLTVAPLPRYLGEDFVGPDPHDWFNACVARYYGVDSISTG